MKREEKSALSRHRILEAAIGEFSAKGYEGASLSAFCAEHGISKGIVYHHFKDKNELYLLCVEVCFHGVTACLKQAMETAQGGAEERMVRFFQSWLRYFADHPMHLGMFTDAVFRTPAALSQQIGEYRRGYDEVYLSVLTGLFEGKQLRQGVPLLEVAEEFRTYMDFYNIRFMAEYVRGCDRPIEQQEARCRMQLDILLHGILTD